MYVVSPVKFCTRRAIEAMLNNFNPKNSVTILEAGCGEGIFDEFVKRNIKGTYLGIDIQPRKTWQAREENGLLISFLCHDAQHLKDLHISADLVLAIQCFEHIADDEAAIKSLERCLKDDGLLIMTVPSEYSFFLYGSHGERRYNPKRLEDITTASSLRPIELAKLGGVCTSVLHFVLWTIPALVVRFEPWVYYNKSTRVIRTITRLEKLACMIDRKIGLFEGGYLLVCKKDRSRMLNA